MIIDSGSHMQVPISTDRLRLEDQYDEDKADGQSKISYRMGDLEINELSISKDTNNVSKDDNNARFEIEYDRSPEEKGQARLKPTSSTVSADS